MPLISFKTDDELAVKLKIAAKHKGINTSAYIKLALKQHVDGDLSELTKNGLTVAEEQEILAAVKRGDYIGPFDDVEEGIQALKS